MNKYLRDVATFPADARLAWRADGGRGVWEEFAERTIFRIARSATYNLYERDLSTIRPVAPPAGVEVRKLALHELPLLKSLMTGRKWESVNRARDERTVFAALRAGRLVGYSWWTHTFDTPLDFSPLMLPSDAVFHGFVHVAREERGKGTSGALYSAGERYLNQGGARLCWSLAKENSAGARSVSGKWSGDNHVVATLRYRRLPFSFRRTLTMAPAA